MELNFPFTSIISNLQNFDTSSEIPQIFQSLNLVDIYLPFIRSLDIELVREKENSINDFINFLNSLAFDYPIDAQLIEQFLQTPDLEYMNFSYFFIQSTYVGWLISFVKSKRITNLELILRLIFFRQLRFQKVFQNICIELYKIILALDEFEITTECISVFSSLISYNFDETHGQIILSYLPILIKKANIRDAKIADSFIQQLINLSKVHPNFLTNETIVFCFSIVFDLIKEQPSLVELFHNFIQLASERKILPLFNSFPMKVFTMIQLEGFTIHAPTDIFQERIPLLPELISNTENCSYFFSNFSYGMSSKFQFSSMKAKNSPAIFCSNDLLQSILVFSSTVQNIETIRAVVDGTLTYLMPNFNDIYDPESKINHLSIVREEKLSNIIWKDENLTAFAFMLQMYFLFPKYLWKFIQVSTLIKYLNIFSPNVFLNDTKMNNEFSDLRSNSLFLLMTYEPPSVLNELLQNLKFYPQILSEVLSRILGEISPFIQIINSNLSIITTLSNICSDYYRYQFSIFSHRHKGLLNEISWVNFSKDSARIDEDANEIIYYLEKVRLQILQIVEVILDTPGNFFQNLKFFFPLYSLLLYETNLRPRVFTLLQKFRSKYSDNIEFYLTFLQLFNSITQNIKALSSNLSPDIPSDFQEKEYSDEDLLMELSSFLKESFSEKYSSLRTIMDQFFLISLKSLTILLMPRFFIQILEYLKLFNWKIPDKNIPLFENVLKFQKIDQSIDIIKEIVIGPDSKDINNAAILSILLEIFSPSKQSENTIIQEIPNEDEHDKLAVFDDILDFILKLGNLSRQNCVQMSKYEVDVTLCNLLSNSSYQFQKILDIYYIISSYASSLTSIAKFISLLSPFRSNFFNPQVPLYLDTIKKLEMNDYVYSSTTLLISSASVFSLNHHFDDPDVFLNNFTISFWLYPLKSNENFTTSLFNIRSGHVDLQVLLTSLSDSSGFSLVIDLKSNDKSIKKTYQVYDNIWYFITLRLGRDGFIPKINLTGNDLYQIPFDGMTNPIKLKVSGGNSTSILAELGSVCIFSKLRLSDEDTLYFEGPFFIPTIALYNLPISSKNNGTFNEFSFMSLLTNLWKVDILLPLFSLLDIPFSNGDYWEELPHISLELLLRSLLLTDEAQESFFKSQNLKAIAHLLTICRKEVITFKLYLEIFSLFLFLKNHELKVQIFYNLLTNLEIWKSATFDDQMSILSHWNQFLCPTMIYLEPKAISFNYFFSLYLKYFVTQHSLFSQFDENSSSNSSLETIPPETPLPNQDFDIDKFQTLMQTILLKIAKTTFTLDDYHNIVDAIFATNDKFERQHIMFILKSIISDSSKRFIEINFSQRDCAVLQHICCFNDSSLELDLLEIIIFLHQSHVLPPEELSLHIESLLVDSHEFFDEPFFKRICDLMSLTSPELFNICCWYAANHLESAHTLINILDPLHTNPSFTSTPISYFWAIVLCFRLEQKSDITRIIQFLITCLRHYWYYLIYSIDVISSIFNIAEKGENLKLTVLNIIYQILNSKTELSYSIIQDSDRKIDPHSIYAQFCFLFLFFRNVSHQPIGSNFPEFFSDPTPIFNTMIFSQSELIKPKPVYCAICQDKIDESLQFLQIHPRIVDGKWVDLDTAQHLYDFLLEKIPDKLVEMRCILFSFIMLCSDTISSGDIGTALIQINDKCQQFLKSYILSNPTIRQKSSIKSLYLNNSIQNCQENATMYDCVFPRLYQNFKSERYHYYEKIVDQITKLSFYQENSERKHHFIAVNFEQENEINRATWSILWSCLSIEKGPWYAESNEKFSWKRDSTLCYLFCPFKMKKSSHHQDILSILQMTDSPNEPLTTPLHPQHHFQIEPQHAHVNSSCSFNLIQPISISKNRIQRNKNSLDHFNALQQSTRTIMPMKDALKRKRKSSFFDSISSISSATITNLVENLSINKESTSAKNTSEINKQENQKHKNILEMIPIKIVKISKKKKGFLSFSQNQLTVEIPSSSKTVVIPYSEIMMLLKRTRIQIFSGFELFCYSGLQYFIIIEQNPEDVYLKLTKTIGKQIPIVQTGSYSDLFKQTRITSLWQERKITNFEYLIMVNIFSGRSFFDTTQYPFFPWVIFDMDSPDFQSIFTSQSDELDDTSLPKLRDLKYPILASTPSSRLRLSSKFEEMKRDYIPEKDSLSSPPPFMYSCGPISSLSIATYLVRIEPFTTFHLKMNDWHFDIPSRRFTAMSGLIDILRTIGGNFCELVPEFYFDISFLTSDVGLGNVTLPSWAKTPFEFVYKMRKALESDTVSSNLNDWFDLLFGEKQKEPNAIPFFNVYKNILGEDVWNFYSRTGENFIAIKESLKLSGQLPHIVFNYRHPQKNLSEDPQPSFPDSNISLKFVLSNTPNQFHRLLFVRTFYPANAGIIQLLTDKRTESGCIMESISDCGFRDNIVVTIKGNSYSTSHAPGNHIQLQRILAMRNQRIITQKSPLFVELSFPFTPPYRAFLFTIPGSNIFSVISDPYERFFRSVHKEVICIAADGPYILFAGSDSLVSIYSFVKSRNLPYIFGSDPKAEQCCFTHPRTTFQIYRDSITCCAVSSNFKVAVIGSRDGALTIFGLPEKGITRTIELIGTPTKIAVTPSWGLVVVQIQLEQEFQLEVYTINGVKICTSKIPEIYQWTTWKNEVGFDCIAYATENRVMAGEVCFPSWKYIMNHVSSPVVRLHYVQSLNALEIIKEDGSCDLHFLNKPI